MCLDLEPFVHDHSNEDNLRPEDDRHDDFVGHDVKEKRNMFDMAEAEHL